MGPGPSVGSPNEVGIQIENVKNSYHSFLFYITHLQNEL